LLTSGQVLDSCTLTLARDVAQVTAAVAREDKPEAGAVVVLLPADFERRKIPRHTSIGQTDASGVAVIRGVIPGDYVVFAVPPSDDFSYYDLEFASRNRESATTFTAKPKEQHTLNLRLARPR